MTVMLAQGMSDAAHLGLGSVLFVVFVSMGLIGVMLALMWKPGGLKTNRGMKQFAQMLRDEPGFEASISERLKARSAAIDEIQSGRATANATDADMAAWVEKVLRGEPDEYPLFHEMRIRAVKERATPHLIRALDDPRCEPRGRSFDGSKVHRPPFVEVMHLLSGKPRPELVPRALRWARSPDKNVCEYGVSTLAASGVDEAIEPLVKVLAIRVPEPTDGDERAERVRNLILGARDAVFGSAAVAVKAGVATAKFRQEVSAAILAHLRRSTRWASCRGFETLVAMDPSGAAILGSPEFLRKDLPGLGRLIKVLDDAKHAFDPAFLESVIGGSKDEFAEFDWLESVNAAAVALVHLKGREAFPTAFEVLAREEQDYRRGDVAEAILAVEGVPGVDSVRVRPSERVPSAVEVIDLAVGLKIECDNGGISQFFFNSTGETWRECVKALQELGCPVTAKSVARSATALGLDQGANARVQYAELSDEDEKRMERDARIFQGSEDFLVVTTRYMLAHAEEFRVWKAGRASAASER